jgi:RHS repeat-associated protein
VLFLLRVLLLAALFAGTPLWLRAATAHAQACTSEDPPCPPPPPLSLSVQSVPGTITSSEVAVYYNVSGLKGGGWSVTSTLNGAAGPTPTFNLGSNGSDGSGSVTVTLPNGTHTVEIRFTENGVPAFDNTTIVVQLPPPPPARDNPIAMQEYGSGNRRSMSGCADCTYAELSYSTPAYRSRDQDRSLTLLYSSALAAPMGRVVVDAYPNSATTPDALELSLRRPDNTLVSLMAGNGTTVAFTGSPGLNRLTALFDGSAYSTNSYPVTATVRNVWDWAPGDFREASIPVRAMVLNERTSGFGSGWVVAGLQSVHFADGTLSDAMIAESGQLTLFARCGATAPLLHNNGTVYALHDGRRYGVPSAPTAFRVFGPTWSQRLIETSDAVLAQYPAEDWAKFAGCGPAARLVQVPGSGPVYALLDGYRFWVPDPTTAAYVFGPDWAQRIESVSTGTLESHTLVAWGEFGGGGWTPPPGESTVLSLNGTGTLERRYPDGGVATFAVVNGRQQAMSNRLGQQVMYGYDGDLRLQSITDEAGFVTTISYVGARGGAGSATITTPGGRTSIINRDGAGQVTSIVDPDGIAALSLVSVNGRVTSATDRLGGATTFTYDGYGGLASVSTPPIQTTAWGYGQSTTTFASREVALLDPASTVWSPGGTRFRRVDPANSWVRIRSHLGDSTRVRTNGSGNPEAIVSRDPLGKIQTTEMGYGTSELVESVRSTSGARLNYGWANGLLTSVTDGVSNVTTTYVYRAAQVETILMNGTTVATMTYSNDGRSLLQSSTSGTSTTTYTHDGLGRVYTVTDPGQHQTVYQYTPDQFGNLASITKASRTTQYAYDGYGRLRTVTDPLGQTTTFGHTVLNRPDSVTAPGAGTSRWSFNDLERTAIFTDAIGQQYRTVANALGAPVQQFGPASTTLHDLYRYDPDGAVASVTRRSGRSVNITRDVLGRPTTISADFAPTTTITYDTAGKWVAFQNSESTDTVFADGSGRVARQATVRGGTAYSLASTFDDDGSRHRLGVTSGAWAGSRDLLFGADALGRPTFVGNFGGGVGTKISYTADHQPSVITTPTSSWAGSYMQRTHSYSASDRLAAVQSTVAGPVIDRTYAHDQLDRTLEEHRGTYGDRVIRNTLYDDAGRLRSWRDTHYDQSAGVATVLREETYAFDAVGNRTDAVKEPGNRVTSLNGYSMAYDPDGNVVARSGPGRSQSLTWNGLGQLMSVTTNGSVTEYGYDGLGRRVRKTANGVTTRYLHDGDHLLMELDGAGQPVREYSYYPGIDNPHAVRQSATGAVFYYATDGRGSVIALVNKSNQVVNQYLYTPFGEALEATEGIQQPFRFAARELDPETGLYYNRARYYDPGVGRFLSEDPIGLAGGVNLYTYAGNNPVDYTDPFGLEPCSKEAEDNGWVTHTYQMDDGSTGSMCGFAGRKIPGMVTWGTNPSGESPNFGNPNARGGGLTAPGGTGSGPSIGAAPPRTIDHIKVRLNCGFHSSATALAAITDFSVARGVAIGYRMGQGLLNTASLMAQRMAYHGIQARYAFGAPAHATMARTGRSAANVAFGAGLYASTTATSGGSMSLGGFASNFVPGWNTFNAYQSMRNVCTAP